MDNQGLAWGDFRYLEMEEIWRNWKGRSEIREEKAELLSNMPNYLKHHKYFKCQIVRFFLNLVQVESTIGLIYIITLILILNLPRMRKKLCHLNNFGLAFPKAYFGITFPAIHFQLINIAHRPEIWVGCDT